MNRELSIRKIAVLFFSKLVPPILNFCVFVYAARILLPEDFGLVALAVSIIYILSTLLPSGWRTYILKQEEVSPLLFSTVLWFHVFCAVFIICLIYIFTVISYFSFQDETFNDVLMVLSVKIAFDCFFLVGNTYFLKNLDYNRIAVRSITASVCSSILTLWFVYTGAGLWAIVIAQLSISVTNALITLHGTLHLIKFRLSIKELRKSSSFALSATCSDLLTSISQNYDSIVIGIMLGKRELGFFNVANRLSRVLNDTLLATLNDISLPTLSKKLHCKKELRRSFLLTVRVSSLFMIPIFLLLGFESEAVIVTLFGEKWLQSTNSLQAFCVILALVTFGLPQKNIIVLNNESSWWAKRQLVILAFSMPLTVIVSNMGLNFLLVYLVAVKLLFATLSCLKSCNILSLKLSDYLILIIKPIVIGLLSYYISNLIYGDVQISKDTVDTLLSLIYKSLLFSTFYMAFVTLMEWDFIKPYFSARIDLRNVK
ncbi:oligosaccharide flippase family protein [Vibrio sinaloensis]|uniref:oligosaccharide flippase family protein n=1 Tax=Photobacterium sp. (strain ATCC 43367) TaxID=379097 RepID=UPI0035E66D66